jgi:hypothetical protein
MKTLLTPTGAYDRSAIMSKAHAEFRAAKRRGDNRPFGYWLAYAWRLAKDRRSGLALPMGGTGEAALDQYGAAFALIKALPGFSAGTKQFSSVLMRRDGAP